MKDTVHKEFGEGGRYYVPPMGKGPRPSTGLLYLTGALAALAIFIGFLSIILASIGLLGLAAIVFVFSGISSVIYQYWGIRYNDDWPIAATICGGAIIIFVIMAICFRVFT